MGFASFLGRLLFASVFILSAYQQKLETCRHIRKHFRNIPRTVCTFTTQGKFNEYGIDGGPAAKTLKPKYGVLRSHVHSYCGVEVPEIDIKHVVAAAIALKGVGGILFISGSSLGAFLLILHQMTFTPILYDFYNYDSEEREFNQLFIKFTQNMALFGALLFFLGMKNSVHRRHHKKKVAKTKTY